MDIVVKLTLVAAIIYMGYNASQMVSVYKTICDKAEEFKKMAFESDSSIGDVRRSNFILSFLLSAGFVVLTYFSQLALWVVVALAAKCIWTLFCSDALLQRIMKKGSVTYKFYILIKADSIVNMFFGLAIALFLIL
ncbi:MAG: hypothetical protein HUK21_06785 [Fibrobacteraceae bacterium]|nr:hypothetical protein [Fibrobacteraceae bacterium]